MIDIKILTRDNSCAAKNICNIVELYSNNIIIDNDISPVKYICL